MRRAAAGHEVEVNSSIARTCWRWALWTTALQVVDGFLLLLVLPPDLLVGIMRGGLPTLGPLTLSILLGVGLLVMLARATDPVANRGLVGGTLAAMTLTVAVMSVTRHQVRMLYLAPETGLHQQQVVPQWGNFLLFVLLLLVALAAVAYMIKRVLGQPAGGDEAA